jgi:hypothetical protein
MFQKFPTARGQLRQFSVAASNCPKSELWGTLHWSLWSGLVPGLRKHLLHPVCSEEKTYQRFPWELRIETGFEPGFPVISPGIFLLGWTVYGSILNASRILWADNCVHLCSELNGNLGLVKMLKNNQCWLQFTFLWSHWCVCVCVCVWDLSLVNPEYQEI